ncbi:tRNA preQ1(34) S-adenosylmethionine ribosyltransferase-isomerase QueA [Candidatus Laterigemmans baculatus]|uniref:tRNA preQ1(34) S-adenosylmethionine ribosyltransferase-isomerase QueA n=1 Tax=Candidatus Laterigemmans baculatus TaxID=2770505 RepID=UPI0013DCE870|nr:tRNA preQ1(34) S-adenosylmethionine ribosyltransferase-isomerase QueA [Candidatus Laterigemmans baculatus]
MSDLDAYDYDLPRELIAQQPLRNRIDARLMVVDRASQSIAHHHVRDLPEILSAGDCLVMNDSRVVPARLVGFRTETRGRWQGLFLRSDSATGCWEVLSKTRGKLKPGDQLSVQDRNARESLTLTVLARTEEGHAIVRPEQAGEAADLLEQYGRIPIPPYIRDGQMVDSDVADYQTVYARHRGSVAAPTAGLHFTKELFESLHRVGVTGHAVTLHVGLGTFRPIAADHLDEHQMHAEWGQITAETAEALNAAHDAGRRRIAIGTTSVRVLESAADERGRLSAWTGMTDLFIKPGYQFRAVDALMTNFHLPRSTLLVLITALAGRELIRRAYAEAIEQRYRFYSYGDAMLIL